MREQKEKTKKKEISQDAGAGLQVNKKTMLTISLCLLAVLIFAGVLTRVLPRGSYSHEPYYYNPQAVEYDKDGNAVVSEDNYTAYDGKEKTDSGEEKPYITAEDGERVYLAPVLDGEGNPVENPDGNIIDGTYTEKPDYTIPIWKIILSPILVFGTSNSSIAILIIVFITLIGGSFLILDKCGALSYIMAFTTKKFEKKKYVLLAVIIFVCMALSSTSGILEESVTLVPIAVAISLALGWDSLVGLTMSLVAVAFGFTAATFNPFNVMTVQKMAGLPVFSGLGFRLIVFVLVYAALLLFTVTYAKKIEKNPQKSIAYESDKALRDKYTLGDRDVTLANRATGKGARAFGICLILVFAAIVLDFALKTEGLISMPSMAILFTVGGFLAGHYSGMSGKQLLKSFGQGVKAIAPAMPLIIFIVAITYVLNEGMIMHTILHYVYNAIAGVNPYAAILLLFLLVVVLEFFVGSGTAKAFLIMPIIIPLAQLVGVTEQSVVLSFCLGDGFTNLLYPTSGIMIIAIGLVNVSYAKWLKYTWKLFLMEFIVAVGVMLLAVKLNYGPF